MEQDQTLVTLRQPARSLVGLLLAAAAGCSPGAVATTDAGDAAASFWDAVGPADAQNAAESGVGATFACGFPMPNAPGLGLPHSAAYDIARPGVVVDQVTGLLWDRRPLPAGSQGDAAEACAGSAVAGSRDWRLPSVIELISLVDLSRSDPSVDASVFAGTPNAPLWTSTPVADREGTFWFVHFSNGGAGNAPGATPLAARCVRRPSSESSCDSRFRIHETGAPGGTVQDVSAALTWERAGVLHQTLAAAKQHCVALGGPWRLPTLKELQSIVDYTRVRPSVDLTVFPETPIDYFWTSSVPAGFPEDAWVVDFVHGFSYGLASDTIANTRCVR